LLRLFVSLCFRRWKLGPCGNWFECRRLDFLTGSVGKEWRDERFFSRRFDLEMKRLRGFYGARRGLGMAPAHHGGVEPLFYDFARAGFHDGFPAQDLRTMSLLIEVGLHAIDFVLCEQTRIRVRVREFQTGAALEDILDRYAPFIGKSFDPLAGHLPHSM